MMQSSESEKYVHEGESKVARILKPRKRGEDEGGECEVSAGE